MPVHNFASQSLGLSSIVNMRELGGYVLPGSRRIKKGLLFRGGSLANASDEDLQLLTSKWNLAVDFDFRGESEVKRAPDRVPKGTRYVWLPAIDPETETVACLSLPKEAYLNLPDYLVRNAWNTMIQGVARRLYTDMVVNEYTQLQYAVFFQSMINTPSGSFFWHCSQGKDRTGLAAAFLLCALGAPRELILQDYCISAEYYRPDVKPLMSMVSTQEERDVIRAFIGVKPEYFIAGLDLIDRRYGSLEAYVRGPLCLTDGDITALRDRFLE